jgi:hypothetical protein
VSQELQWWLLRLDATGKVLSCSPVDQAAKNGESWVYIQARDAKAAERAALNSYMREVMRRRRAELDKAGKCRWCGRVADRGTKRCSVCLAKDVAYQKRGRDKAVPVLDKRVAVAQRKAEERSEFVAEAVPSIRLSLLIEVQEAWQNASTNGLFTRWLNEQIAAARGKKVA